MLHIYLKLELILNMVLSITKINTDEYSSTPVMQTDESILHYTFFYSPRETHAVSGNKLNKTKMLLCNI
jgi:hypothetical protein